MRTVSCVPALVGYLRRWRPATLLSALHANYVALCAKKICSVPRRVVISEHNTFSRQILSFPKYFRRIVTEFTRRLYPWADGIVAVSRGVAEDLVRSARLSSDSIEVIYNPVLTPEVKAKAMEPCPHPWLSDNGAPVILSIGRLSEQKDFDTLINAFSIVRRRRPARLMILGEGELRPSLELLVRQRNLHEDVVLPGFVSNPFPYMSRAAVFVLSSCWEGLPTVLIEALYCGAKIVSTDCLSGPREILNNGRYGELVPVGSPMAMADAIKKALSAPSTTNPDESWQPYECDNVLKQYTNTLLGS